MANIELFVFEGKDQELCFQVKTCYNKHNSGRNLTSNMATRSWVTSKLVKRLLTKPMLAPKKAMEHMTVDYNMITRALKIARKEVMSNEKEQYGKTRDYLHEILRSNPVSTAIDATIPHPEELLIFNKLYIFFDACKRGFKAGCRPLIGLDGCFLKGYFGRELLSAVEQDANNHSVMIAFAMVDSLQLAIEEEMPRTHHRNCVLHIWKNFCAKSTTILELRASTEKLRSINEPTWEYMSKFDPALRTKSHFSHYPKIDNITNNMCEVWNAKIVEYRSKPILTLSEDLRCYLMRKIVGHKKRLSKYTGKLALVQQQRLDDIIKLDSNKWNAEWSGNEDRKYQAKCQPQGKNMHLPCLTINRSYFIILSSLLGVPCPHAVATISRLRRMNLKAEDFVHDWFTMDAIQKTYEITIKPEPTPYLRPRAPSIKRPLGRPKLRRKVDKIAET
ncbi:hypothetical protein Ahy_A03g012289 isoform A [Arachis hypogaea]|uniref:Protein FAR1-RELATED SEQUENCE n=1 Tax=Arachis hypogaea TaxID=3818 RepID=A0A445DSZ6_ARAHY|nr:hypothetical protein Ahy_A03g012289 isoform A [Arachis hypogaea]